MKFTDVAGLCAGDDDDDGVDPCYWPPADGGGGGGGGGCDYDACVVADPDPPIDYDPPDPYEGVVTDSCDYDACVVPYTGATGSAGNPANLASEFEGSTTYLQSNATKYPAGSNKCNEFVADMLQGSDRTRPQVPKSGLQGDVGITRDPSAKEWFQGIVPGYTVVPLNQAQRGDVIAMGHADDNEGHVGIYMGNQLTASVSAWTDPAGIVMINDWGFRETGKNGEHPGDPPIVALHWNGGN